MNNHYSTDNECLLTGGLWSLIVALILGGLSLFFVDVWPAVILGTAVFVIGFIIAAFMCKTRTVGRGYVTESAVALARAEMGLPEPVNQADAEAEAEEAAAHPEPEAEPKHAEEVAEEGEAKPELLTEARGGAADDLKKIKGVGPKLEKELNNAGVFHFDQIAGWSAEEVAWADQHLVSFKGRVSRDSWVAQATELAK